MTKRPVTSKILLFVECWEFSLRVALFRFRSKAHLILARCATAMHPWIHTPDDGRGMRAVYLDGKKVDQVVYADTRRGIVRIHHNPIRVNCERGVCRTYKRTGKVEVVRVPERISA